MTRIRVRVPNRFASSLRWAELDVHADHERLLRRHLARVRARVLARVLAMGMFVWGSWILVLAIQAWPS